MSLSLVRALRTASSPGIAFVGAGGKTTAMFQLAYGLKKEQNKSVMVTATSHLGLWQTPFADTHIIAETPAALEENKPKLEGIVLVTGDLVDERTKPLNGQTLNWLHQYCEEHSLPLLIEADGSRQRPLKAWTNHEPPIPPFVSQVVQVVGITGVEKPLNNENVHRPEAFSFLSGLNMGEPVTRDALIKVLNHTEGGLKNVPVQARRTVLINQADTAELQASAHGLVRPLLSNYDSVIIASLKQERISAVHEPIAGIILAAGESTRFGETKQLLDWKGKPFVRAVSMIALEAGLSPVIVVTGANAEKVESTVKDLDVAIVRNEDWKSGQGSSIKAAVQALSMPSLHLQNSFPKSFGFEGVWKRTGGAIFLLTDQPQITTSILHALVQKHADGLYSIVAPMVMDRRANPVLFDRDAFPDLMTLEGDVGGRAVFHKHHVEYLPWHDDSLLLDVDTPEMYQRLISDESL
jgi:molybdenum cofactor cytidylyltransferase